MIFKRKTVYVDDENIKINNSEFPKLKRWRLNLMDLMRTLSLFFLNHILYGIDIEKTI